MRFSGQQPKGRLPLGYDIRQSAEHYLPGDWPNERRNRCLVRPEIEWPISIDTASWPSVFEPVGHNGHMQMADAPDKTVIERWLQRADGFSDFWLDPGEMMGAFQMHGTGSGEGVPIYIEIVIEDGRDFDTLAPQKLDNDATANPIPPDWVFLGHDVADGWGLSGLSKCGYGPDEAPRLRQEWAGQINDHGLLQTLEAATAFREITDIRIPPHAPFFVFAIFRAPKNIGA